MKIPFRFSDAIALAAAGTGKITFSVANGLDFVWIKGLYSCTVAAVMAGTDVTGGGATVRLSYTGAGGRNIDNKAVPISHYFGLPGVSTGPMIEAMPLRFAAASAVTLDLADTAGGGTFTVTLIGYTLEPGEM